LNKSVKKSSETFLTTLGAPPEMIGNVHFFWYMKHFMLSHKGYAYACKWQFGRFRWHFMVNAFTRRAIITWLDHWMMMTN